MELAKVIGKVWATKKTESLSGVRFILAQLVTADGELGRFTLCAADNIGAGVGDLVLISRGGGVKQVMERDTPVDACVIAIVDSVEYD